MNPQIMQMAMQALAPQLEKLTDALHSIEQEHGVKNAIIMIMNENAPLEEDKPLKQVPVLCYMHVHEGSLLPIRDKEGKAIRYAISQIGNLIMGGSLTETEED